MMLDLVDEPGRLGMGEHRQAAGVPGRRTHRPLQAGDGLDVVVEHVGPHVEQRLQRVEPSPSRRRSGSRHGRAGAGRRIASTHDGDERHAAVGEVVTGHHREHGVIEPHPVDRLGDPCRLVGGRGHRLRVSTRQKPHARVHRSPSTMNVAVPSDQHSDRFGQPASSHTVTRSSSRIVFLSCITSGPSWTFGTQPLGLAGLDRQPLGDAGLFEASVRTRRAERDRLRRDPRRARTGVRSSGRCCQATSWRSTTPPAHRSAPSRATTSTTCCIVDVDALLGERGDGAVGDPAGDDVLAHVHHVGRDVEGEAVHRATPRQPDTDRGDLARVRPVGVDPHARIVRQPTGAGQAQLGERVDQQLLDRSDVLERALRVRERHDRVADELPGAVIGDVAAAVSRRRGRRRPRPGRTAGWCRGRRAARR